MSEVEAKRAQGAPWPARLATDWRVQLLLAVAAVGLALAVGAVLGERQVPRRKSVPAAPARMPEALLLADSWRAAAAGDEKAYLACFTGEAREELAARLARVGREAFRKELRATAQGALGVEWGPPQPAADGGLRFPVSVLRTDGAEAFDYAVVKVGADWRIRSVAQRGRRAVAPPATERLGPPAKEGGQK